MTWAHIDTWTAAIDQIKYVWANSIKNVAMVKWVASLVSVNDTINKDDEQIIALKVKPNSINNIENDNKKYKLWLALKVKNDSIDDTTKFISLTNWDLVNDIVSTDNNWMIWKNFILRKSMINVTSDIDWSIDKVITSNNSEYSIYKIKIDKLNKDNNSDYVKQLTFKINTSNSDKAADIVMKKFKIDVSTDWDS